MANAKKAPAAAQAATPSADLMAQFAAFMAAQGGATITKAKATPAKADPAAIVTKELEVAGAKIIRSGKAGSTAKSDKMWVDVKVGNVRIQGNAFVIRGK